MDSIKLENDINIASLFERKLTIPPYQRSYCWEDKQINDLLNTLTQAKNNATNPLYLGVIILHKDEKGAFNIIDGQQRLTTLSLLLETAGYKGSLPLMSEKFCSLNAQRHIANAKHLLKEKITLEEKNTRELCDFTAKHICFSILTIEDNDLDIAYSFFSNQNSGGVPLTDYELLKAHHLGMSKDIDKDKVAKALEEYDELCKTRMPDGTWMFDETFGIHLYRLRLWSRDKWVIMKREDDKNNPHRVYDEYKGLLSISKTTFESAIGTQDSDIQDSDIIEFCKYAKTQTALHTEFRDTLSAKKVLNYLWSSNDDSNDRFASVILTLLYGYFLKFGEAELPKALYYITHYMAQCRYNNKSASKDKIMGHAKALMPILCESTDYTNFVKETLCKIENPICGKDIVKTTDIGKVKTFYQRCKSLFSDKELLQAIESNEIKEPIKKEYGD